MRIGRFMAAGLLAAALTGVTAPAAADTTVHADLVEQNKSGVTGSVTLTVKDDGALRVQVDAEGLVPGVHAQHIHGAAGGGHFHCASMSDDTDGDGWLTNEEASGEYGNVYLALTTRGDVSADSGLSMDRMPEADGQGRLRYDRTIPADQVPDDLVAELANVHVVQHGIDANGNGTYDRKALGESTFAASLGLQDVPEEATNPASCGVVVGAGAGQVPEGGVETGSGAEGEAGAHWLTLPGVLLVASGVLLEMWRRRRARTEPDASR